MGEHMKVIIAPDSYKGSLSALEVCKHIEVGLKRVLPTCTCLHFPMADGGEGTTEAIALHNAARIKKVFVKGPQMKKVEASFALLEDNVAVMEMASASGLPLCDTLDVMRATSYGTGELIKAALDCGCTRIYIGLGGSATNDGGIGMLQALGVSFQDEMRKELALGAYALSNLHYIDITNLDERLKNVEIIALCDVINPLYGSNGATAIYGKQKGANCKEQQLLERNLYHFSEICKNTFDNVNPDAAGSGAAGGMGFALQTFLQAKIESGIQCVMKLTQFEQTLIDYDLIISGEGCLDSQSMNGKVIGGLAQLASKHKKTLIAIVGSAKEDAMPLFDKGLSAYESCVTYPCTLEMALKNAGRNIEDAAQRLMQTLIIKCEQ